MEITGVIQHQIEDHLHALAMGGGEKPMEEEIPRSGWMSLKEVMSYPHPAGWGYTGVARALHKPAEVRQTAGQPLEIADAIAVAIGVAPNDQLIDDGA